MYSYYNGESNANLLILHWLYLSNVYHIHHAHQTLLWMISMFWTMNGGGGKVSIKPSTVPPVWLEWKPVAI